MIFLKPNLTRTLPCFKHCSRPPPQIKGQSRVFLNLHMSPSLPPFPSPPPHPVLPEKTSSLQLLSPGTWNALPSCSACAERFLNSALLALKAGYVCLGRDYTGHCRMVSSFPGLSPLKASGHLPLLLVLTTKDVLGHGQTPLAWIIPNGPLKIRAASPAPGSSPGPPPTPSVQCPILLCLPHCWVLTLGLPQIRTDHAQCVPSRT